jgi:ABC-2 type transport system ATP-binding protein
MSSHITSDLEKIADMVTFIDKGKILLSGYKDEIIEQHGILKCDQEKLQDIDSEDIVSIRTNNFGAEVMVNDRENASYKYSDCVMDPASLDDIMLYYVHRDTKEWS